MSTSAGLDRFREFAVSTISDEQDLPGVVWSVLAGRDGSVWMGGPWGLSRLRDGHVTLYGKSNGLPDDRIHSLFQDDAGRICVSVRHGLVSFANGRFSPTIDLPVTDEFVFAGTRPGNLWIAGSEDLLRFTDNRVVEQIPWSQLGAKEFAITMTSGGARRNLARIPAGSRRRVLSRRKDSAVLPGGRRLGRGRRLWIEARPRRRGLGGNGQWPKPDPERSRDHFHEQERSPLQ